MSIKRLNKSHYEDSLNLSMYAFQYKVPEEEKEKRFRQLDDHELFGIEEDGMLAAKLHLLSLDVILDGRKFAMGGIAGVATYPEYRRRGFVKDLLSFSLARMKEKGQTVSMLHPFSISFYRKYGWEIFSSFKRVKVEQADLKMLEAAPGYIRRFDKDNYPSSLENLYEVYSERFSGMLVRTKDWWKERVITSLTVAIYYNEEGKEKGYILYQIKDQKMKVEELIALDSESRRGLWNFICQHDSMIKEAEMILSTGDPLPFLLHDPQVKSELNPYFMARIVDVKNFLQQYFQTFNNEVSIKVTDKYAPWNNKTFTLSPQGITESESDGQHSLKVDITGLVPLFFGVFSAEELHQMGILEGDRERVSVLEENIKAKPGFFIDFF